MTEESNDRENPANRLQHLLSSAINADALTSSYSETDLGHIVTYHHITFVQVSGPRIGDKRELFWSPECFQKSWGTNGDLCSQGNTLNSASIWGFMLPGLHKHSTHQRRWGLP